MKRGVVVLLALGALAGEACTGVYVGRKVSADGSTLLARTVDCRPIVTWHRLDVVPHVSGGTNVTYRGRNGFERTWPGERLKYVCTPMATCFDRGRFVSMDGYGIEPLPARKPFGKDQAK